MTRLVWAFGWVGVAIWSAVCAVAYGVFDLVGNLLMRNADAFASDPDLVVSIWKGFSFLHGLSTGTVAVVWAVVSLLILAVPWVLDRAIGSASTGTIRHRVGRAPFGRAEDGVIDLAPDQYRVEPAPPTRPGPATRPGPMTRPGPAARPGPAPRIAPGR